MVPRTLVPLDAGFAICRLAADSPVPSWAADGPFVSINRTADELSVVCRQETVPEGVQSEPGWGCLRVAGTLDLSLVGVLASLLDPLAQAGISVLALSTFDTDYLLVKQEKVEQAMAVLRQAGVTIP